MLARSTIGALGVCVTVLALAALAAQPGPPPGGPARRSHAATQLRGQVQRATPGIRALREGRPLDLNRAQIAELQLLPGIGPTLAERIVESRRSAGPFASVRALGRVKGIGPRKLERLTPFLRVGHAQPGDGDAGSQ